MLKVGAHQCKAAYPITKAKLNQVFLTYFNSINKMYIHSAVFKINIAMICLTKGTKVKAQ